MVRVEPRRQITLTISPGGTPAARGVRDLGIQPLDHRIEPTFDRPRHLLRAPPLRFCGGMPANEPAMPRTHRPWMRKKSAVAYMGGISQRHLENLIAAGVIPARRAGRVVLIHPDDIDAYLRRTTAA